MRSAVVILISHSEAAAAFGFDISHVYSMQTVTATATSGQVNILEEQGVYSGLCLYCRRTPDDFQRDPRLMMTEFEDKRTNAGCMHVFITDARAYQTFLRPRLARLARVGVEVPDCTGTRLGAGEAVGVGAVSRSTGGLKPYLIGVYRTSRPEWTYQLVPFKEDVVHDI